MTEPTAVLRRSDAQVSTVLDDEVVALHTERNTFFTMNPVASRVWGILERPTSFAVVCDLLVEEFEVDRDVCVIEVGALIDTLVEKGLVVALSNDGR
jgi:hypothetical protein